MSRRGEVYVEKTIALAGNPNTGKSTVFNALTGLKQHTGNWSGKTVLKAEGHFTHKDLNYRIIDLPGTYSLMANSMDEQVARDFICFDNPDVTIVVLDATSLERNMNLALQVMEVTSNVIVCLNLMDEAYRKGIRIDVRGLANELGVLVIPVSARKREGLVELKDAIHAVAIGEYVPNPKVIKYSEELEEAIKTLLPELETLLPKHLNARWVALRILSGDQQLIENIKKYNEVHHTKQGFESGREAMVCH